jgi:4-amino-4-deoxy-L-arabinose transferase-like glycosyltransferase
MQENLDRFIGGSGHSHPVYYYVPYLFSQSVPWSLFLPILLWDFCRTEFRGNSGTLFLKLWFLVMFVFFSVSVGKRMVYLLPLYPALSLLLARWFYAPSNAGKGRSAVYRIIAIFAAVTGGLLLAITLGALWNHEPAWFFAPIESLLRPKDRANVAAVRNEIADFGWMFTVLSLCAAVLWLTFGRAVWQGRLRAAAHWLAIIAVVHGTIGWSVVMPVIAREKSYKSFMIEVNQRVKPEDRLYIYGRFNSHPIVFYRGAPIERLDQPIETVGEKIGKGGAYIIMPARRLNSAELALVSSEGTGPEGDAPLVLVRADLP